MRLPWHRAEKRDINYSDVVAQAAANAAGGDAGILSGTTAAMELAAGWYGRAFASAKVTPAGALADALTPEILASIGRALCESGEAVYLMDAGDGLTFTQASAWQVTGGYSRATWMYEVTINGPTSTLTTTVPATRVFHPMYSRSRSQPWKGIGPLDGAHTTRQLGVNIDYRLAEETAGNTGSVIPVTEATLKGQLQADLRALKGRLGLVPTVNENWEANKSGGLEWTPRRLGAHPPEALVKLREGVSRDVTAACGVPVALLGESDGTALREGLREFLHGVIQPLAAIIAGQLFEVWDELPQFDFSNLYASDIMARTRAVGTLVTAGMVLDKATKLVGLVTPDDD